MLRRSFVAGGAGTLAAPFMARTQQSFPKITIGMSG
jgi:hypothetical protein